MNDPFINELTYFVVFAFLILVPISILIQQNRMRIRGMMRVYKYERLKRKDSTEDEVAREIFRRELMKMKYFAGSAEVDAQVKKVFPDKATIREACFEAWLIRKQKGINKPIASTVEKEKKIRENIWRLIRLYSNHLLAPIDL